jgi:hypothetical protein
MFEKGWRSIFIRKQNKIHLILRDLEVYLKESFPQFYQRVEHSEYLSLESTFTTQLITLYSYDAPVEIATRIFELFLVDGA